MLNSLPFMKNNIFGTASGRAVLVMLVVHQYIIAALQVLKILGLCLFMLPSAARAYCLPKCRVCMESCLQPSPCYHCRQRIGGSQPTSNYLQKWEGGRMLGSLGMDGGKLGPADEIGPGESG